MSLNGIIIFLLLTSVLWASLSIQINFTKREKLMRDKNQQPLLIAILIFTVSFTTIRLFINSRWNLETDWDLFNGLMNFFGIIILYFGYKAINIEIQSRKEERAIRKYETFISVNENIIKGEFQENLKILKALLNRQLDVNMEEKLVKAIYTCLVYTAHIQKLIKNNILDFEDIFVANSFIFLEFYDSVKKYAKQANRGIDETGDYFGLPEAIRFLKRIKEYVYTREEVAEKL